MPATDIDPRYGDPGATPTPWSTAEERLATAELFWLSTVRPDGRPHVTPLLAVWHGGALHVCTGQDERKARNLAENPQVVLTTGTNALHGGLDVVVEGEATRVVDPTELQALADVWEAKYGPDWHFDVADGGFANPHGVALVFRVEPATAFGFGKAPYSQTRWRF
ncbi:pyridoxamine 5'-phosphate oxidase family protein [Actinosynnema sp. CS-041913]|uniref:pyridoxamine 5'-phosphate oxidase family protein n=1 Tax=Actinosynnema sp. CS-041913 TaxID=3239917 RepID=UPI003D93EBA9